VLTVSDFLAVSRVRFSKLPVFQEDMIFASEFADVPESLHISKE
jgi:hypothetical protein